MSLRNVHLSSILLQNFVVAYKLWNRENHLKNSFLCSLILEKTFFETKSDQLSWTCSVKHLSSWMYPDYYKSAYKITDAFSWSLKILLSLSALTSPYHPSDQYKSLWYTYCNDLHVPFSITRNRSPPPEIIIWPFKMFHRSSIQRKKKKPKPNNLGNLSKKKENHSTCCSPLFPWEKKGIESKNSLDH